MSSGKVSSCCPKKKSDWAFEALGFRMVREREHIVMVRENPDGTPTPLVMPNQREIQSGTLRAICTQTGISREDFLRVYEQS